MLLRSFEAEYLGATCVPSPLVSAHGARATDCEGPPVACVPRRLLREYWGGAGFSDVGATDLSEAARAAFSKRKLRVWTTTGIVATCCAHSIMGTSLVHEFVGLSHLPPHRGIGRNAPRNVSAEGVRFQGQHMGEKGR